MRLSTFSFRLLLTPAIAGSLLLAACGGDDGDPTGTPGPAGEGTPAPTATPLAIVPDPIVVTGDGSPSSGGSTSTETSARYTVEDGDTLSGIAARFGVDIEVIQEANDLDGVNIFIGQELVIPRQGSSPDDNNGGSSSGDSSPSPTSTPSAPSGVDTYTVQAGDTAFGIALEFDTTVEALEEANGVGEGGLDDLQIGQVIQLPRP